MTSFVYNIPTKVYFGPDHLKSLGSELKSFGKRVLLCYGGGSIKKSGLYDKIVHEIKTCGLEMFELSGIEPNPRVTSVNEGANICKEKGIDVILAVGGGSTIDCSKFIAAATYYNGDAWDILLGKVDVQKCLPIVTVLTLSATGSEMDCAGVISNEETHDKIGKLFPSMLPKVSFLDPTLTYTVSRYQTACGAADIFSHICEVYFNMNEDLEMLDSFMEVLLKTVIKYAPIALREPDNYEARANLMWTSSWAINGFINGGKNQAWSCHPIEHELSAFYDITHGLGLAILTPRWMEYTLDQDTAKKFYKYGVNVFGINSSAPLLQVATMAIQLTASFFFKTLGLQSNLSMLDITNEYFKVMSEKAVVNGNLQYAFKPLEPIDVEKILEMSL